MEAIAVLQTLRSTLSVQVVPPAPAPGPPQGVMEPPAVPLNNGAGDGSPKNQAPWLVPESLTFPGLSVVAGLFMNFLQVNQVGHRWLAGALISLVFGGFLLYLSLTDPNKQHSQRGAVIDVFVGLVNVAIMFITIVGVGSINVSTG